MSKLNLKGVDLNLLTVFEAVMETGKLSTAGDRLGMSQPAMSAALQRLRLTVGDQLFIRTRTGMEPTPRAQEWFEQVHPALEQIRLSLQSGRELDLANSERRFSILAGDYFETLYLPPLLEALAKEAPSVSVELMPISADGLPDNFRLGHTDLAIHYLVPKGMPLGYEALGGESLSVIARQGHPRLRRKPTLKQFQREKHVMFSAPGAQQVHLDQLLGEQAVEREILVRVSHFSSAATVVESTDAIATVPTTIGRQQAEQHNLQCLPFPLDIPAIPKHLIWPKVLENDPMHRWFRALVAEIARDSE